jgi:beta-mannosidase
MKTSLLLIFLMVINFGTSGNGQTLKWELGYSTNPDGPISKWIPSTVPGAVQLDIARAEKYQPYGFAEHWKDYLWMEDCFFTYRTAFKKPALSAADKLFFISKGIDYKFEIYFNGKKMLEQEGMFTPVSLDLTQDLKEDNSLLIKLFPIPKHQAEPADRSQASYSVKPAVSYGWDWHPRLVPLGIWDDTYLEVQPASFVDDTYMKYQLNDDFSRAEMNLEVSGRKLSGKRYRWELKDREGKTVAESAALISKDRFTFNSSLENPHLWWCHDQGEPYLYHSVFTLTEADGRILQTTESNAGFRRVHLVMNTGAWDEPSTIPKTRSIPPIQMELNGRRIFCKGSNWVNPEIFPGIITRERYLELLNLAKGANFNILRVWGGGIVNKESFFELCDQLGILIWQEFPLACNKYPDDPHYLQILKQESASIIKRLRKHSCLALWCGGNELFNSWSGMDDQSLALRLLNSQCLEYNPSTPFIPTSPLMGMGHGHYIFRDWSSREEVYQEMNRSKFSAYTEFGVPAPASEDLLKTIIPAEELWPPKPGTSWESHHAYGAWGKNTWLCEDIIEDYFGKSASLAVLVANGQLMQAEGYKCIFEGARRQKPYCSMALNWCYNEPWVTAANNSILSYPDLPKPGYYAVKAACRPVLASAQLSKFQWKEGEEFFVRIWMLNDQFEDLEAGKVSVKLVMDGAETELGNWDYKALAANGNLEGPVMKCILPAGESDRFKLILRVEGHPEYDSEYTLAYKRVSTL